MLPERQWVDLATASGNCGGIPAAIEGLRSKDAATRSASRWLIDNHVVVQGDLYEGAPWTAQALVSELSLAGHPGRVLVYDILMELMLGSALPSQNIDVNGTRVGLDDATHAEVALGVGVYR